MDRGDQKPKVVEIDGSVMEGGGQILRISMALSCLTNTPIHVYKIRAGRSKPGLRPQHLTGIKLVSDVCRGRLESAVEGSTDINFTPGPILAGHYQADTGTAGSVALLVQVSLPCLLYAGGRSHLTLRGGTDADMAPPVDYLTMVLAPTLKACGINFHCNIKRRGFFPRGQGEVEVEVERCSSIEPITLTQRGEVTRVTGRGYLAGSLPHHLLEKMCAAASHSLGQGLALSPNQISIERVQETRETAFGNGSGIILVAETSSGCRLGASALGKRGVTAESVGESAAKDLINNLTHGGCVDDKLQDQLILFMALASGRSEVRCGPITEHTNTAIYITQTLTQAKFTIQPHADGSTWVIECEGVGMKNSN